MMRDRSLCVERRGLLARLPSVRVLGRLSRLAGVFLAATLVLVSAGCGRGKPESRGKGDLPYAVLDKSFQPLRTDFEDADGKVRLVGIVAPTCGECILYSTAIDQSLLPLIPGDDIEVFLVWVCAIPPDIELGAHKMAERLADPRIRHYWDGTGRIARAFGRHAGMPDGAPAYGLFYLYGRADTWDPEGKMASEPAEYNAVLEGWEPGQPRVRAGKHPRLPLPLFDVQTLRSQIEQLRAEPDAAAGGGRR